MTMKIQPDERVTGQRASDKTNEDQSLSDAQLEALLTPPIAFNRIYAEIAESAGGGVFLSQLKYWSGKCNEDGENPDLWVYKTAADWNDETMLSRRELDSVRKVLRDKGVIQEKLSGIPAKLFYRLNKPVFFRWVRIASSAYWEKIEARRENLVGGKRQTGESGAPKRQTLCTEPPSLLGGKRHSTNRSETTSETTSNTKTKKKTPAREKRSRRRSQPESLSFSSLALPGNKEGEESTTCGDQEIGPEPEPVAAVEVAQRKDIIRTTPIGVDPLLEEFGPFNAQQRRYIADEYDLDSDNVLLKAEIVRSEPRENAAKSFLAAIRDDWQPPKALSKPKAAPRQQKPPEAADNEVKKSAAEWDAIEKKRVAEEIAAYLGTRTESELAEIETKIGPSRGGDRQQLLGDYAERHLRIGRYADTMSDAELKARFKCTKNLLAGL